MVVTGLGAVSPFGRGIKSFIAGLRSGDSGVRLLSKDRQAERVCVGATSSESPLPEGLTTADSARLPKLSPMALAAGREAMDMSGLAFVPSQTSRQGPAQGDPAANNGNDDNSELRRSRRIGLVLGTGGGGIDFTLAQAKHWHEGKRPSLWTITNATHGNLAGELSIGLGLRGPSQCVSTGCASSSDAVGRALEMLRLSSVLAERSGEDAEGVLDAVVVVGADAHVGPETLLTMDLLGVLSRRACRTDAEAAAACRPFDARRDGFVLGEGAWAMVLERAASAGARRASPVGSVLGYAATCDAYHRVRPEPSMAEGARAMRLAVADAGLSPTDIEAILYHGTGTAVNDASETVAVKLAFGDHAESLRGSSIKGAIGHPQGACGAASCVAVLGSLGALDRVPGDREGFWPPTINLTEPDDACDLNYTPNESVPSRARRVLVNCLAFGAKNSALVLEVSGGA